MRRCTMSKKKDPKLYELILDWTQSGNLLWKRLDDEETNDPFVKRATDDMNIDLIATVYKGNIIKNLIMDCQSYTKYRPNETTGGIFVSWRRKEELPTGA